MADNTTIDLGSGGDTIATDDIAGVKHQRVKIEHGADGSATDASAAAPLPTTDAAVAASVDGLEGAAGAVADAESTSGDGSIIALLKNLRTRIASVVTALGGGLPAALTGSGNLKVANQEALPAGTNAIGKVGHDTTGLADNRKTVTTAGTAVALATTTAAKWVIVTALTNNTQQVNVGSSTVLAASGTSRGVPLLPGDSVTLPVDDLAEVFVDSRVNGEGVSFAWGT